MSMAPSPARVSLPQLAEPPATILAFLCARFPQIVEARWRQRIREGKVSAQSSAPITATTPYRPGETIFYFREVEDEPAIPFREEIIYQDEHLLLADKPHFLPV